MEQQQVSPARDMPARARDAFEAFCAAPETLRLPVLAVAAHPDDETIGMGSRIAALRRVHVAHVTDGAPADPAHPADPRRAAFARLREEELAAAMRLAGVPRARRHVWQLTDQDAPMHLAPLARGMANLIAAVRPVLVVTHPYEGGHPDHDATAFAVRAALRLLAEGRAGVPMLVEAAFYHAAGGLPRHGEFIPGGNEEHVVRLDERAVARKRAMRDCHASQARALRPFSLETERFRLAAPCSFLAPPHDGPLHYERQPWKMTGTRFCALARDALAGLGLPEGPC